MLNAIEDYRNEFKVKLTDKFEEEVVAFLNAKGGNIFIGIADNGNVVGIDGASGDTLQGTYCDIIADRDITMETDRGDIIMSCNGGDIRLACNDGEFRIYVDGTTWRLDRDGWYS